MAADLPQPPRIPTSDLAYLIEAMHHLNRAWGETMKRYPLDTSDEPEAKYGRLMVEQAEERYEAVRLAAIAYLTALGVQDAGSVAAALGMDYGARFAPPDPDA